jgi:hypothetical protein
MKSSFQSLISPLSFLLGHLRLPSPELDTILDNSTHTSQSQGHIATDGQSVSLLGLMTRYLLLFHSYGLVFVGRHLWREEGSVFFICCWPLPAQSFSGPSPLGLAIIFYCLRFKSSHFVASYDSQGHGGGIRPRLHTGSTQPTWPSVSLYNASARTTQKTQPTLFRRLVYRPIA